MGDHVRATGRVVSLPGRRVRFCAPLPVAAVAYAPGHEPAPAYCPLGVDISGVDLAVLSHRREKDGAVEGAATLDLRYESHYRVAVLHQATPQGSNPRFDQPAVPCPPPQGGWPVGPANNNIDLDPVLAYARDHPGTIFKPALLRPSPTQVLVYVLTVTNPEPVAAALHPYYGARLCVARSRYTSAEVETAAQAFEPFFIDGPVYALGGGGFGPDAQPIVEVELVLVTPEIAAVAEEQPAGLVRLEPWLRPHQGT